MQFYIHNIQSPVLKQFIQYILFNFSNGQPAVKELTSFANTNICLGILKDMELREKENGDKAFIKTSRITSYLSGIYSKPHRLTPSKDIDEICIDFSPLGYYHFFPFRAKKYILNEDILSEAFGKNASNFFDSVFREKNFVKRAILIEQFLCSKIISFEDHFLSESLAHIHNAKGEVRIDGLSKNLNCSEKKLYRTYINNFEVSPQEYIRIVRFRNALSNINQQTPLTKVAYQCGYYDQSHFIKEIKYFTNLTPKNCRSKVHNIGNTVCMGIS